MNSYYDPELSLFNGCNLALKCKNNQCIFRREQMFGLTCWATQYKYFYDSCCKPYTQSGVTQVLGYRKDDGECHNECTRDHSQTVYPSGVVEDTELLETLNKEYGPEIIPTIQVESRGTNRWALVCKDFK